jgi:ABC-2 type transport system permease protein
VQQTVLTNLIEAEWRKATSVWLWWELLAFGVVVSAAATASTLAGTVPARATVVPGSQLAVGSGTDLAYVVGAIAGAMLVTSEFRYRTIRLTFLVEPVRYRIVLVKAVAALTLGTIYGVSCSITMGIALTIWSATHHLGVEWLSGPSVIFLARAVFIITAYSVLGAAAGLLVRNQLATVSGVLLYVLVGERLLSSLPAMKHVYPLLPGGVVQSLTSIGPVVSGYLGPSAAAATLLGWILLGLGLGWLATSVIEIP